MSAATLKPNLESILMDINQYINIDQHREIYANHFEKLKIAIFTRLRSAEPFGYLFNGYQLGGSYGDNLKVTIPNEFDLVFHIRFPENELIIVKKDHEIPGNVHLDFTKLLEKIQHKKEHETTCIYLRKWLNADNCLIVKKFQSYFQSCFTKALEDMDWHFENTQLRYHRAGPAHTIKVNSLNMQYSVDFVPGILMDQEQSVTGTNVGQWEAIPKPIKGAPKRHTSFHTSFYRQEQKLISGCNNLKNCLRMMKLFRDAHSNMSCMKSYFIKTLFLWKVRETQSKDYWNNSLSIIILD
ncbi:cyclic GMP-AMP synthase-like receptor, partial [Musca vetustissima]|uniref:cyclic GMP-AMP synthase-like receptor n=1 Tax=Musca vetustissima TaxID=27455 RepID=UPI002AB7357F